LRLIVRWPRPQSANPCPAMPRGRREFVPLLPVR
jgi:hypothetical protein